MERRGVHPYTYHCRTYLENGSRDPMFSGAHLKDLIDYLSTSSRRESSSGSRSEDTPFVWSYIQPGSEDLQLSREVNIKDLEHGEPGTGNVRTPRLLILAGHPSPSWLNAVGYKYQVDPHFFQRHMSFQPSAQVSFYAEPSLPSNSRHILKLNIPTIGYIDPWVQAPSEDIELTRQRCNNSLRQTFRDRRHTPTAGSPIVRRLHLHDWKRFTLEQEVSMYLSRQEDGWTIIVWTDAGSEDRDPLLPLSDLPVFTKFKYDFVFCPTILDRPAAAERTTSSFKTIQKFNLLHRVYGRTLSSDAAQQDPFYALHEVYSFAAAAENQFLNMMEQILSERIESLASMQEDSKGPNSSDLQYDRNILDAHHDQIKDTAAFLATHDDETWFQPFQDHAMDEAATARFKLTRDYRYLESRIAHLILRCERAMEMISSNAALSEAKRSNYQSEGLAKLTRMTTFVTILYVPLSFICSFFGMNFSIFGQGHLGLWIYAAVTAPVLILSLILLRKQIDF